MNQKESLVPLSEDDIRKLKKNWITMLLILLPVAALFSYVAYTMGWQSESIGIKIFSSIFVLFPIGTLIYVTYLHFGDLQGGTKVIIRGVVTDKQQETKVTGSTKNRTVTTYFYLFIDGVKNKVEGQYYLQCAVGNTIELHKANVSKTDLNLIVTSRKTPPASASF